MKSRLLLVLAQVTVLGTILSAQTVPQLAVHLLEDSRALIEQFPPADRPYYLEELTRAAVTIMPRKVTEDWCTNMFTLALHMMSPGWNRVAEEKNALIPLAEINPALAMRLLREVENPQPDIDGVYPEDSRSSAAAVIFPSYWQATQLTGLGEIEAQASHIGETGEYPYRAMGLVIAMLPDTPATESMRNTIFRDALRFYRTPGLAVRNRNTQFLRLLQTTRSPKVEHDLFKQGLQAFVSQVFTGATDGDYAAEINGVYFTDRRRALLFQVFPLIKDADPKWARRLSQRYKELAEAKDDIDYISAGVIISDTTPDEAQFLHRKMLQQSLVERVQKKVSSGDIEGAKQCADRLTDDRAHIVGTSLLLPSLMKANPEQAQRTFAAERTRLQALANEEEHLQAAVALAEAAYNVHDDQALAALTSSAFDDALRLFTEDSRLRPQLRVQIRRGYGSLTSLVRFGVSRGQEWIPKIYDLQDIQLRAALMIAAAQGLSPQKTQ